MKKLLSFLLCIVFLQAQVFALVGGPVYDDGLNVNIVGTYSGTMTPVDNTATSASSTSSTSGESINSLGLFSLSVPAVGAATGTFVIFQQGIVFAGKIVAVGDPSKGSLVGLIQARYDFISETLSLGTDTITFSNQSANVNGIIKAQVIQSPDFDPNSIASLLNSFQRIEGTAAVAVDFGKTNADGTPVIVRTDRYIVDGIKQSNTVNSTSATSAFTLLF